MSTEKKVLLSGMRPTGKLHLGHYLGVLKNWVKFQNEGQLDCFFMVADWHSLTTKYNDTENLASNTIEMVRDFLAAGIDPAKSVIFVQSGVPQIAELHLLLSMITPNNWVERDPTLKDLVRAALGLKPEDAEAQSAYNDNLTYGMLGYPVLQAADILSFCGSVVPVGKDQEAHLEMSREIARRFNHIFKTDFFPEPKPVFTETPTLMGVDGTKMGKSFGNDIKISDTPEDTIKSVKRMITDPQRQKKTDPGSTERCQVPFPYYKIFADEATREVVKAECEAGQRGCVDCKLQLANIMNESFAELRTKRESFSDEQIHKILAEGTLKARQRAESVLATVRKILKMPVV